MLEEKSYSSEKICWNLRHNKNRAWFASDSIFAKGYLFASDGTLYQDEGLLKYFSVVDSEELFAKRIKEANGCFAVLISKGNKALIAVDRIRSFPLFYISKNGRTYITDEIESLANVTHLMNSEDKKNEFAYLGYTTGRSTLIQDVYQIQAGEYMVVDKESYVSVLYHTYIDEINIERKYEEWKAGLKKIITNVGKRLVTLIDGRPVAIPLSGGYDSRLIAYLLHKEKYERVLCFTYGKPVENAELKHSKTVADRLGFEWCFVDYMIHGDKNYINDPVFLDYCKYITQFSSCYFYQEFPAIQYLIKENRIPSDAFFIPGHSGDFIAGSHLRSFMRRYSDKNKIAIDLLNAHFQGKRVVWKDRKKILSSLVNQLTEFSPQKISFQEIENWDLKERQAKYIVNSAKIWEYFGFSYCLPLWDTELMDYFSSMPFDYKLGKMLYDDVLRELFTEEGISFEDDFCLADAIHPCLDELKNGVKRYLPFIRKKPNLWRFDSVGFKYVMEALMQELHAKGLDKDLCSYNGASFAWYLLQLGGKV
jgi:asparagine synthase (glutamine-hydrolysing)